MGETVNTPSLLLLSAHSFSTPSSPTSDPRVYKTARACYLGLPHSELSLTSALLHLALEEYTLPLGKWTRSRQYFLWL